VTSRTVADSGFTKNTQHRLWRTPSYVNNGSPTVTDSYFSQNQSNYGGGIYNDSNPYSEPTAASPTTTPNLLAAGSTTRTP